MGFGWVFIFGVGLGFWTLILVFGFDFILIIYFFVSDIKLKFKFYGPSINIRQIIYTFCSEAGGWVPELILRAISDSGFLP